MISAVQRVMEIARDHGKSILGRANSPADLECIEAAQLKRLRKQQKRLKADHKLRLSNVGD